jgi:hypothetical protein
MLGRRRGTPAIDSGGQNTRADEDGNAQDGGSDSDLHEPWRRPGFAKPFPEPRWNAQTGVAIQFRPNQPAKLAVAYSDQAPQRSVLPRVPSSHQNRQIDAVDDDPRREAFRGRRHGRTADPTGQQEFIETRGISHPQPVREDLYPRFRAEADDAPESSVGETQTRRRQLHLGPHGRPVDRHLERLAFSASSIEKRRVAEHRVSHPGFEILGRRGPFEHDLGASLHLAGLSDRLFEISVETDQPPFPTHGPGPNHNRRRRETKDRPESDPEPSGRSRPAPLARSIEREEITFRVGEAHSFAIVPTDDAIPSRVAANFDSDTARACIAGILE